MVAEGVIALIWAAAGCSIYAVTDGLSTGLSAILANGQSAAIYDVCSKTMGGVGVALAMIGVIVCSWCSCRTSGLYNRLEIFQLDKPDTRYDCIVDSKYVLIQRKEELLDYRSTGNLYECRIYDLFLLCTGVLEPRYNSSLPGRYHFSNCILWHLHVCNKETAKRSCITVGV